jgi:hypothetical protein
MNSNFKVHALTGVQPKTVTRVLDEVARQNHRVVNMISSCDAGRWDRYGGQHSLYPGITILTDSARLNGRSLWAGILAIIRKTAGSLPGGLGARIALYGHKSLTLGVHLIR